MTVGIWSLNRPNDNRSVSAELFTLAGLLKKPCLLITEPNILTNY